MKRDSLALRTQNPEPASPCLKKNRGVRKDKKKVKFDDRKDEPLKEKDYQRNIEELYCVFRGISLDSFGHHSDAPLQTKQLKESKKIHYIQYDPNEG
jgi:hypothetical protein